MANTAAAPAVAGSQQQQQRHAGSHPKQQQQQQRSQVLQLAQGVLSTCAWCFASSALIVANSRLYRGGFPYPMTVTGLGQLASVAAGLLLAALGLMPLRPPPARLADWVRLVPVVGCTAGTMFLGNAPYMYLSMSFIQILKAFTPALTLVVGAAVGVERLSAALVTSVLLIAAGTGAAVAAESGSGAYSSYGLLLFMGSSLTEAGRVVASQLLLGPYKYSSTDVLVYVGLPAAATLIGGSLLFEARRGMLDAARALLPGAAGAFAQAGLMSAVVNVTSYWAIASTSSLTFKVSGCLKNLGVVWFGVAAHGDVVSARHLAGYAVSMGGFALYSATRQRQQQQQQRQQRVAAAAAGASEARKRQ